MRRGNLIVIAVVAIGAGLFSARHSRARRRRCWLSSCRSDKINKSGKVTANNTASVCKVAAG